MDPKPIQPEILVDLIDFNEKNLGDRFQDDEDDDAFVANLREHGVLQPVVVVAKGDRYELIAGERRVRAVRKIGWAKIPAVIRHAPKVIDEDAMLSENFARRGYSPWETLTGIESAVLRARERAKSNGHAAPNMSAIASSIGLSERTAYYYWTIAGQLDPESRTVIHASEILRHHLTGKDLERVTTSHHLDRPEVIQRLEEFYKNGGKLSPRKRERLSIERKIPLKAGGGKKRVGTCQIKPDPSASIESITSPRLDVVVKLHPSTDLEDAATRDAIAKHLRLVLNGLVRQMAEGFDEQPEDPVAGAEAGADAPSKADSPRASSTRSRTKTRTASSTAGSAAAPVEAADHDDHVEGEDGGMIEDRSQRASIRN